MSNTSGLSDAKRALLAGYLHGNRDLPMATKETEAADRPLPVTSATQSDSDSRASVVAIQSSGSRVPFFFPHVHWQGGATYCFTLARELGPDQPFYIVEPYRFEGLQSLPTLEDIAAECVKSVRAIQPDGPYRLGGYCGAGFIVFEMAQQLHASGQRVDKLVMIEPGVGPYYAPVLGWIGKYLRRAGTLLRLAPDRQLSWFLRMRHIYKSVRYPGYRRAFRFSLAPNTESLRADWLAIFVWIVSAYVPRPYHGKVTYLWAQDASGSHRNWWQRTFIAQETEINYTAGDRSNCRSTYVHDLATQLRTSLS
jgi:Thioesterase domain